MVHQVPDAPHRAGRQRIPVLGTTRVQVSHHGVPQISIEFGRIFVQAVIEQFDKGIDSYTRSGHAFSR
jgi:hypothetical protein